MTASKELHDMVDRLKPNGWLNFQAFLVERIAKGETEFAPLLESVNDHVESLRNQNLLPKKLPEGKS